MDVLGNEALMVIGLILNSGITLRSYREMKTYSPLLVYQQLIDVDSSTSHNIQ